MKPLTSPRNPKEGLLNEDLVTEHVASNLFGAYMILPLLKGYSFCLGLDDPTIIEKVILFFGG